ncbi:RAMP superfamily CRISPR-associated protein [Sorangium sp. So ce341]|uniref:RAMP superfamily CRISPR-associated protein n=1 Tax=Sorangium sp. So ce341 TaxID=3133302 RepID=UPI003F5D684A
MSEFELVLSFPSGSVLIGGHSPAPEGVNIAHARLPDGRPVIPASALRGALREALEALLRAVGEPACAGGNGEEPRRPGPPQRGLCQLAAGTSCRSCRLFGGGRSVLPEASRTFSALVLGEAAPVDEGAIAWRTRHGVAIDRRRRSASNQRLFRRAVPEEGLTYRARGRLIGTDEQVRRDFEAAVAATTHIGAGKSGGLARVEMKLQWVSSEVAPRPVPPGSEIELSIVLRTPASIGVPLAAGNFRDTRLDIPGSALRGAIGFALAEILEDPNEPDFQALVAEDEGGAIFDFLYPVDGFDSAGIAGPWPLTARQCKADPSHGVVDTLLDRIAVDTVRTPAEAARVAQHIVETCPVAGCGHVLRSARGSRRASGPPRTRLTTRVAMDRQRASARDKMLFSHAQIERGAQFVGRIRNIREASREHLGRALQRPLSVGRARAMGWGAIDIVQVTAPAPIASVTERGDMFDRALARRLEEELGLAGDRVGRLIAFTLLSPLLPPSGDDGRAALGSALGCAVRWPVVARRFDIERGWDQRTGPRDVARAVQAGAVFVAELVEASHWRELSAVLARIESQGVGDRTRQGFGRVLCFDPFIYEGMRQREDG